MSSYIHKLHAFTDFFDFIGVYVFWAQGVLKAGILYFCNKGLNRNDACITVLFCGLRLIIQYRDASCAFTDELRRLFPKFKGISYIPGQHLQLLCSQTVDIYSADIKMVIIYKRFPLDFQLKLTVKCVQRLFNNTLLLYLILKFKKKKKCSLFEVGLLDTDWL